MWSLLNVDAMPLGRSFRVNMVTQGLKTQQVFVGYLITSCILMRWMLHHPKWTWTWQNHRQLATKLGVKHLCFCSWVVNPRTFLWGTGGYLGNHPGIATGKYVDYTRYAWDNPRIPQIQGTSYSQLNHQRLVQIHSWILGTTKRSFYPHVSWATSCKLLDLRISLVMSSCFWFKSEVNLVHAYFKSPPPMGKLIET